MAQTQLARISRSQSRQKLPSSISSILLIFKQKNKTFKPLEQSNDFTYKVFSVVADTHNIQCSYFKSLARIFILLLCVAGLTRLIDKLKLEQFLWLTSLMLVLP